jgi:alpha-D-ribose 1-methylphosphonate 5-triphosphate synthase subunit PhnL
MAAKDTPDENVAHVKKQVPPVVLNMVSNKKERGCPLLAIFEGGDADAGSGVG